MTMNVIERLLLYFLFIQVSVSFGQTYDGYTLYSKMGNTKTYLLTMDKSIYHTWTLSSPTGYSSYLLPNHHLLRSGQYSGNQLSGAAMCGIVQDVDWNGTVAWQYVYSTSTYCSHHDICPMPNGNVLLIAYEVKTPSEVTQAGCSQNITMWPDKIVEIQPSGTNGGTVVWEWHAWDHLCQNYNASKNNYVTSIAQHPELLNINYNTQKEWLHVNGIDYNPALDQIVISSHNLNEIYVIDHSTTTAQAASHTGGNSGKGGDILYRWGNPAAYSCGSTANQVFKVVHDAHWIPEGCPHANDLVGFNNQGGASNGSCIDRITPPYSGYTYLGTPGTAYTPSSYNWRHNCLGNAQNQSSSQQLPNGNTFICISTTGYLYEIDSNQNVVWSYTVGGSVAQAFRYSACYVNGNMEVDATASPSLVCQGASTQLGATVTNGSNPTYAWTSNPAGFTSTLQNPVVSPSATTKYYLTVTSGTCTATDSVTVTVADPFTVAATATPASVCPGQSVQLNAAPSGSATYTYNWSSVPQGFTSTLQNPVVNPIVNTVYYVTANNGTCSASGNVSVTISSPINLQVTASPSTICSGQSSQLNVSASGSSNYTYQWSSVPAGFSSTLQNPIVTPTVSTVYTVIVSDGTCSSSGTVTVTLSSPFSIQVSSSPGSICSGQSSQLYASVTGTSNYTFAWTSNPPGFTSTLQNPVVSPSVYTVYSVIVSDGTCSGSDNTIVSVSGPVSIQAAADPVNSCPGNSVQLSAITSGGVSYQFSWISIPAGFTSTMQNPVVYPDETTVYIVSVQSDACSATDSASVFILPVPATPVISKGGDTLFSSAASGNQWFLNGNILPGSNMHFLIPEFSGYYQVQVTLPEGCSSSLSMPYLITQLDNKPLSVKIYLFPNPAGEEITIRGNAASDITSVELYDVKGVRIFKSGNIDAIDVSVYPEGLYVALIAFKQGGCVRLKFVVQR